MDIWNRIIGMCEIEITGADPEASLDALLISGMDITRIRKKSELTAAFFVPQGQRADLEQICRKRGDLYKIISRIGVWPRARSILSRPLLCFGMAVLLSISIWLPSRVLFVRVEGNSLIAENRILEAAQACGIGFGASRREVRSEKVKNALLSSVPQLQWAGVNTAGCTAVISVREKTAETVEEKPSDAVSILASRDGYVLSAQAEQGNLLVKPGEAVRQGQVLISAYTDCGISIRVEEAKGEVFAQTNRRMNAIMPSNKLEKRSEQRDKRKISLLIRKKRIILWKDSGIWEGTCGRMYEEYYITLPGGFQLPIALCTEVYDIGEAVPTDESQQYAESTLVCFSDAYLRSHMISGKIINRIHRVQKADGSYHLVGSYVCEEMIGIPRQEKIGDTNG